MTDALVLIENLNVSYRGAGQKAHIIDGVDITIGHGQSVGLVGESGSGKSTVAFTLLGLLADNAEISANRAAFDGRGTNLTSAETAKLRGTDIAMVFQDPMTALNPMFTIGTQLVDIQRRRFPKESRRALWARAEAVLSDVGLQDAAQRMHRYPHEFSGGMRQRVVIAMALLVEPKLLIADEPTTALDATVEAQVVEMLHRLRQRTVASMLVVSHSMGLIAELCDNVIVMYAGTVVENGKVTDVLHHPHHPYTRALLNCEIDPYAAFDRQQDLATIPGTVPDPANRPQGCIFAERCPSRHDRCSKKPPRRQAKTGQSFFCWLEAAR
ncbi:MULTISPECIES: ABC transporter ATP-binding protein [Rhizobium/Agrobacterium group]|uniref:ABC transporter ATP-binding protein n=1 Tax=Rhizobium/Agrobacterium group TaxID=227290 RepID=UPI00107F8B7D|nr:MULTISPECIES: ABC transporter ATP-binding protein [Rhizobium/Agrobacterium group]MBB4402854.1 peptide/nickel transport system ATP-binding protein [Agrobacterium radiobacter]MBB5589235.1 peptide/nickel transport system ATP-binding protein [Agrobacterium radiobacter]TGE85629.1 peptide ABC transporter ATP-binding protein [Rhizobium sp. SEMIA 4032]